MRWTGWLRLARLSLVLGTGRLRAPRVVLGGAPAQRGRAEELEVASPARRPGSAGHVVVGAADGDQVRRLIGAAHLHVEDVVALEPAGALGRIRAGATAWQRPSSRSRTSSRIWR